MRPVLFLGVCLRFNDMREHRESERAMSESLWEVYAVKYADRNNRTRFESFMFDPLHEQPHPMDYFVWVLKSESRTILVDTGYDTEEAERRGRPILRHPVQAIGALGRQEQPRQEPARCRQLGAGAPGQAVPPAQQLRHDLEHTGDRDRGTGARKGAERDEHRPGVLGAGG